MIQTKNDDALMIEKQVIFKERNASWTKFQENVYFIDLFENQA